MEYVFSNHAKVEIERRKLPLDLITSVIENPQQVISKFNDRKAFQSKSIWNDGREFILRVIIDDTVVPAIVITVYKTSKIYKYWR